MTRNFKKVNKYMNDQYNLLKNKNLEIIYQTV